MACTSHAIDSNDGVVLRILTDQVRVLATAEQTDDRFEIFDLTGPRDSGPPPHSHAWSEAYFMIEGEVEICMDRQVVLATPGSYVQCAGGKMHTFRVKSASARMLVITGGAGASAFFHDMSQVAPAVPCDMAAVLRVASKHGLQIAPPG